MFAASIKLGILLASLVSAFLLAVRILSAAASPEDSSPYVPHSQGSPWHRYQLSGSNLQDVDSADGATWAVGSDGLLARWDGGEWSVYDNTKLGAPSFNGVDVVAADAAWAVASRSVARWNGTAWVAEPSNTGQATMNDVSMVSPTDGWIAGSDATFARYNGTTWQQVSGGDLIVTMNGVDAVASNDVWAVGGRIGPGVVGKFGHWDGSAWTAVFSTTQVLYDVDMLDTTYGWAVGMSGALWQWNGSEWTQFTPPNTSATLKGVSVLSHTDAWAVGAHNEIWHWNGTTWSAVPVPPSEAPVGIKMVSNSEGWAVGPYGTIYRWNGMAWSVFTTRVTTNGYYGLDFVAPHDGWAVGVLDSDSGWYGLQHWNGATWEVYQYPGAFTVLEDIDMLSSDAAWAVGSDGYVLHWDGTSWIRQTGPTVGLSGVSMVSATDGWAAGGNGSTGFLFHYDGSAWTQYPGLTTVNNIDAIDMVDGSEGWAAGIGVMLHYQNSTWTQMSSAYSINSIFMFDHNEGWAVGSEGAILHYQNGTWSSYASPTNAILDAVYMLNANEGWAVGSMPGFGPPVMLHYLNGTWSAVQVPTGLPLFDVYAFNSDEAWAVGYSPGVILRLGSEPVMTPTPVSSGTPGPPATATHEPPTPTTPPAATETHAPTSVPATSTPIPSATGVLPTPTVCAIEFSDAPPGSTFHDYVRCLACRGIVQGYPDGTFHPYERVTRGQTAKIVAAAAQLSEPIPPGRQTFTDVPPGHTFHLWVERLAGMGAISGYPCGGPGEPCDQQSRSYFRPNAPVTRGQFAKIVAEAAQLSEPIPPGRQTFEDVPPGHTFHLGVERVASAGIINGYVCGPAQVGPCVAPLNRPYFLWSNTATRGQAAKLVSNTFYPGCEPAPRR